MPTYATFVTSKGEIKVELLEDTAPKTVANFVDLAKGDKEWTHPESGETSSDPLYPGTRFHRVIPNFMIQGGDPIGTGTGGPGYRFEDEVDEGPAFDGPGYLAMANAGPNTNGSQFFITVAATPHLTGKHTIFGKVVKGQKVADEIAQVPTGPNDRPKDPVVVEDVVISGEA